MEKVKKTLDFNGLTGLFLVIIALIYGYRAYTLPRAAIGNPIAPSIYPLVLAILLLILGGILLVKSNLKESIEALKISKREASDNERLSFKMIGWTCVIALLYAAVFNYLGYVISTFLFMLLILMIINGKSKWKINIMVALLFSVGIYMIFSKLLGISLPQIPYLYI